MPGLRSGKYARCGLTHDAAVSLPATPPAAAEAALDVAGDEHCRETLDDNTVTI